MKQRIIRVVSIIVRTLVVVAMIGAGLVTRSPDVLALTSVSQVIDTSKDGAGIDSADAIVFADKCHTCSHVVVPIPTTNLTGFAAMLRWEISEQQWVATNPSAETPPPRMLGNEALKNTSIPIIEVNYASLCTNRFYRASRRLERTG